MKVFAPFRVRAFLAHISLLFYGTYASALCSTVLNDLPITRTAIEALSSSTSNFDVKILVKNAGIDIQAIVLLGETHNRHSGTKAAAEVVKIYPYRAIELTEKMVDGLLIANGLKALSETPKNKRLAKPSLFSYGERGGSSTIDDAVLLPSGNIHTAKVFPIDVARDRDPFAKFAILQNRLVPRLTLPGTASAFVLILDRLLAPEGLPDVIKLPIYVAAAIGMLNTSYSLLNDKLGGALVRHENSTWFKYVSTSQYGILTARNEGMSSEVNNIFASQPGVQELLTIVGRDHLPGMVKNFKQDGWEEVDFLELQTGK